jgi:shikimate kinase/3-dehydroquinate synthase
MRQEDNLILTGFMATGKTATGREVARRLGREFVDMDALVEAREGLAVAEIFCQKGEAHFRRLEAALCRELAARPGLVIATGGGALLPAESLEIVASSGPVVCLTATADEINSRLEPASPGLLPESGGDRPLLHAPDRQARIAALLAERTEAYRRIPLQVDTTGLTVDQVAGQVLVAAVAYQAPANTIPVRHPAGEYAIRQGRGLLDQTGMLLRRGGAQKHPSDQWRQAVLVTNPTVGGLYSQRVLASLEASGCRATILPMPDGEAHKTLDTVRALYDGFVEAGLDRQGVVLALGGGVVGDMAGFAAATYLRGVSLVQLPTSLLAMVDASVGGKVAIDLSQGKNLVGAFKQPQLVITDVDALSTLPEVEVANGLAEVVKAGLLGDPDLFEQIEAHGPAPLPWIVRRAVEVKVAVVQEDPLEEGWRAVLNLGHTFGHALEVVSGYALSHGQAVSVGLVAAAHLSARMGLCAEELEARVRRVLDSLGLPTSYHGPTPQQLWQAMATDKKRRGGRLRFVLLHGIGKPLVTDHVAEREVLATLAALCEEGIFRGESGAP